VGGDLLRSAKDSIKNTELFTVVLVVLILGMVYRSPLLIAMPLVTITVSLVAATAIVALLTQVGRLPGFDWWNFQVFTTTRIFIVVILFGAGTDYFLFLVARYKEELQHGLAPAVAIEQALAGVGDALAASALTTILGLGTMFLRTLASSATAVRRSPCVWRYFGRVCYAGSRVAACVGARGLSGRSASGRRRSRLADDAERETWRAAGARPLVWERVARGIVRYPGLILTVSVLMLLPLAYHGDPRQEHDLRLSGAVAVRSVAGQEVRQQRRDHLRLFAPVACGPSQPGGRRTDGRHFPVGESGPVQVIAFDPDGRFDTREGGNRSAS
jgi:putative drug exporter of the RND superfamily